MGIASQQTLSASPFAGEDTGIAEALPVTNLAALLDQFTRSVMQPHIHTVGSFATTIGALHGELAMLARHFGAGISESEAIDFDDIFPDEALQGPKTSGVAADDELEHVCRELSR